MTRPGSRRPLGHPKAELHQRLDEAGIERAATARGAAVRHASAAVSTATSALRATSAMIAASSCGRDPSASGSSGRSTHVTSRSSARPPRNAQPFCTPSLYCSDGNPVAMTVVGTSRRASLVSTRGLAEDARLRHRPPLEGLELLLAEPVEVLLRLELLLRGNGISDALEVGVHRPDPRAGIDVDHGRDASGTRSLAA